jgi:uncharacterized membrane-anchored protein YhcB (DUF1043 family)
MINMTGEMWLALGVIVGLYALSLIVGFIWLHFTSQPSNTQNKLNKLIKKGNTNGR